MSSSTCASTSTAGIQETLVSSSQEVTIQEEQETLNLNDTSQIDEPVQKKLKSSVWQNFQRISRLKASCLICQKEIIISQGSTSALQRHYDRKHGSSDATQVNKTPRVQVQPLPNDSTRSKLITNAIAFMMSRDLQPSSIVEDDGFKNLIQTLEPRYELPARTTFSRNVLPKIAKEQEVFLRTKLELGLRDDLTPMEIMMRSRIRLAEMDGRKDEIEFNNEFQRYLDELCIGMRENILTWWSNNKNKYSKLSEIALDTLGIVSTSASSERCFSHAGAIKLHMIKQNLPKTRSRPPKL
uniref:BED-type domain-containing protein n=1 Tax=Trichogramma kaykai TaxID=54128 RepID=A0ABD2VUY5_9HYME